MTLNYFEHICNFYCIKMEFQKIVNFLDTAPNDKNIPKFATKKWFEVYDQSERNYNPNKEIRIKTSMLRSDSCDYSNAYIVVKGTITFTNPNNAKRNKSVGFKSNSPFINCISKINCVQIDNAKDLIRINCEVELILTWSKNCVLTDMTVANNPPAGLEFQITDTSLFLPVVTLPKENDIKLLEKLKYGFKKTLKWNKYRSQMTIQNTNNNLNYLIDPTLTNINRLFVLK